MQWKPIFVGAVVTCNTGQVGGSKAFVGIARRPIIFMMNFVTIILRIIVKLVEIVPNFLPAKIVSEK